MSNGINNPNVHTSPSASNGSNHFEGLEGRVMMSGAPATAADSALAFDAKGNLHVAYYDAAAHNLKYMVQSAASGTWSAPVVVDKSSKDVGEQVSISVDKTGLPGIAYRDVTNQDLKYAHFDGKHWIVSTVDSKQNTGVNPSLAYDKQNHALISYYRPTAKDLQLAQLNGKTWTFSTIATNASAGQNSSIAIDPATGKPAVAFEGSDGKVRYVEKSATGFTAPVVVDKIAKSGSDLSLAFGPNKKPAFSYYDPNTGDIKLAVSNGKKFTVSDVASVDPGQDPGAKVVINPATGQPEVVYYDSENDGVFSADKSGNVTLVGQGGSNGTPVVINPKTGKIVFTQLSDSGNPVVQDTHLIPLAPGDLDAEAASATRVDLTWSDNSDNEAGFLIERSLDGVNFTTVATTAANVTSYSDTGVHEATDYTYRITAVGPTGVQTPADDTADVTTLPAGPSNVVATTISDSSIHITWSDNSNGEDGYTVERSDDNGATFDDIADLPAGSSSYQDDSVDEGTTYRYRITATNDAGSSAAATATATSIVAAPSGLAAVSVSASQVNLAWTDNSAHETGFVIERSDDNGSTFNQIGTVSAGAHVFVDSTVTAGAQYTYRVKATGAAGPSTYVTSSAADVIPAAPTITATTVSTTRVNLAWSAISGATSYTIERSDNGGDTFNFLANLNADGGSNIPADFGVAASPDVLSYADTSALESSSYQYRIRAVNTAGASANSNVPAVTTFLAAPGNLAVQTISANQINLTWTDNSTGETGFSIERSDDNGTTFTQIGTANPNATTYHDTTAAEGASYIYQVRGYKNTNFSDYTFTASATTSMVAPTGLTATASSLTQIDLAWADNSSAETGYEIYRSTDNGVSYTRIHITTAGATAYSDTVVEGSSYKYKVRAVNAITFSADSSVQSVTTKPAAPTALSKTVISSTQVNLTWTDNSNGETGYRVERSTDGGAFFTTLHTLSANSNSDSDTTAVEGASYVYRVIATNSAGDSVASNTVTAVTTPAAPGTPTITVNSATSVHIAWADNSSHEAGYIVERSSDNGVTFASVSGPLAANTVAYDDTTAAGTSYVYRVLTVNTANATAASGTQSVLTLPAAVAAPTATTTSATSAHITWTGVTSAVSYLVEVSANAGSTWTTVGTSNTTNIDDTNATEGGTFIYRVTAHNATGNAVTSASSSAVTTVPAAPTGLTATPISASEIDLAWTDNSSHETGYIIERSSDNGTSWTALPTQAANAIAYPDTNVTGGATFTYRVHATGAAGSSTNSTQRSALTVPAAISNLVATTVSASATHLTWSDTTGETGYVIERSSNGGTNWTPVGEPLAANTVSFDDTGLSEGATYTYRVTAADATGSSAASNLPATTTLPAAPAGLTATPISASEIDLAWADNSAHETGYILERSSDGGTSWSTLPTQTANTIAYADTNVTGGATFTYRIHATGAAGSSTNSNQPSALTIPAAIANLAASTVSASATHLTWTDVTGETGYVVEHSSDGGTNWTPVGDPLAANIVSFDDTGLSEGATYTYRVTATDATGSSAASNLPAATTLPATPTVLSKTPVSATRIDLTWTDNSSHETGYRVQRSDDNGVTWNQLGSALAANTTTYSDLTTTAATSYKYRVIAIGTAGDSLASNVANALTVPAAPGAASAIASADTHVSLSWTSVAGATGYSIERSDDNGITWNSPTTVGNVLSYADASAAEATLYVYRVSATNATGIGIASPTTSVTTLPAAATNLTKTVVSATRVDLAWTDNSSGETGYLIERSSNAGANYTPLNVISPNITTYSDTTAVEGTVYIYRVKPVDITGTGAGITVNATTIPAAPDTLVATPINDGEVDLTWHDHSANETGYIVERSDDGGTTWNQLGDALAANTTSYPDTTVTGGANYKYRVHATGTGGNSALSNVPSALTIPASVTDLTPTVISDTEIDLTWTASTGATGYELESSTDGGTNWNHVASPASSDISYQDTGLAEGTHYKYRIVPSNATGANAPGSFPTVYTSSTAPTTLTATQINAGQVTLAWTDNSSTESGFVIQRSDDGGDWGVVDAVVPNATTYQDTSVTGGVSYQYRVFAIGSGPNSAFTNVATALTIPAAPTTVVATVNSSTHVTITWDAMNGAASYLVEVSPAGTDTWTTVNTTSDTTLTDAGATEATSYDYRVTAINTAGSSASTSVTSILTLAAPVTDLAATPVNAGRIDLTWTDPSNGESSFRIERSDNGGDFAPVHTTAANATSWSDTSNTLTAGSTYAYRIFAVDATADSAVSNVVTKLNFPDQVTGLTATPATDTLVTLQWNPVATATGYLVEASTNSGSSWSTLIASTPGTVYGATATEATAYLYRVTAINGTGPGVASSTQAATSYAALPTTVTATPTTATNVNLSWTDNSAGETGFIVERSDDAGITWNQLGDPLAPNTATYSDTTVTGGNSYEYRVTVTDSTGSSPAVDAASPALTIPAAVTGFTSTTLSTTAIDWSWNAVHGATGYQIDISTNAGSTWTSVTTINDGTTTIFHKTGLTEGTAYLYQISPIDDTGAGAAATHTGTTLAAAASTLGTSAVSNTEIDLTWADNSSGETGYKVRRSDDNGETWTTIHTTAANATSYPDITVTGGTSYKYQILATDSAGDSPASNTITALTLPDQVTGVNAQSISSSEIDFTWTPTTGADDYIVEISTNGGGTWTFVTLVFDPTFKGIGLTEGTTYDYQFFANNDTGFGAASDDASVTTIPSTPTNLTATATSATHVDLTWSDNSAHETGYDIYRSADAGANWTNIHSTAASATSYTDANAPEDAALQYKVVATGNGGSADSNIADATTPIAAPTVLTATATSNSTVSLSWTDNSTVETGYIIERSTDAGANWAAVGDPLPANALSFNDTGLTEDTTYTYRVTATDGTVNSDPSNTPAAKTALIAPTSTTIASATATQVNLTWSDNSSAETGYKIERSDDNGVNWTVIHTTAADATSYSDTTVAEGASYKYQIRAANVGNFSAYDSVVSLTTIPATPSSVTGSPFSTTRIDITWADNSAHESGYIVERSTDNGVTWTDIHTTAANATTYSDTGRTEGTDYQYRVRATSSVTADSADSAASSTVATDPAAPTSLTTTVASATEIDLAWTDNSNGETAYVIERSTDNGVNFTSLISVDPGTTSYHDTTAAEATAYVYRVRADRNASQSTWSNSSTQVTTLSAAATSLVVTTPTNSRAVLAWTDNSAGETGFKVQRSTDAGVNWTTINTTIANANTYSDNTITEGGSYQYRVIAFNTTGDSLPSNTGNASTPPASPTGLSGSAANPTRIDLSWINHSSQNPGFYVERSTNGGSSFSVVATLDPNTTSWSDSSVTEAHNYQYRVRAFTAGGNSGYTTSVSITTPLNAPTNITATPVTSTRVDITWADNSGFETQYKVERSTDSGVNWTVIATTLANVTSYSDTTATEATPYLYRVRAAKTGNTSLYTTNASVTTLPAAPTGLTATVASATQVNLAWTDHSAGETGFIVERSADAGATWTQVGDPLAANTASYNDTTASEGAAYLYRVHAINTGGSSTLATSTSVTTLPAAPTGLTATSPDANTVTLTWTDNSAHETGYKIERSDNAGSTWTQIDTVAANVTTYSDTTVDEGASYQYRVRANLSAANSAYSSTQSVTTVPLGPDTLTATTISSTEIDLAWDDLSGGETSYRIERSDDGGITFTEIDSIAANSTSYHDTTASEGLDYQYRVRAHNAGGFSGYSPSVEALTKPAGPSDLVATLASSTEIDLAWTDNSVGEDGFYIERDVDNSGTFTYLDTLGPDSNSYADTTTTAGHTYTYRLRAFNSAGDSTNSNTDSATT